jgi:hypothetical protein
LRITFSAAVPPAVSAWMAASHCSIRVSASTALAPAPASFEMKTLPPAADQG